MGKLIYMDITIGYLQSLGQDLSAFVLSSAIKTINEKDYLIINEETITE